MQFIAVFVLITLPWLHPFALGPTTSVVPLLVSWACAAALALTGRPTQVPGSLLTVLGGLFLLVMAVGLWPVGAMPGAEVLALAMGLLAILACALRFAAATQADATVLARAWLAAGLVSALMGWVQYVGAADALAPWVAATPGEAFGNLRQRNLYASLTSTPCARCSGWPAATPGSAGPRAWRCRRCCWRWATRFRIRARACSSCC